MWFPNAAYAVTVSRRTGPGAPLPKSVSTLSVMLPFWSYWILIFDCELSSRVVSMVDGRGFAPLGRLLVVRSLVQVGARMRKGDARVGQPGPEQVPRLPEKSYCICDGGPSC